MQKKKHFGLPTREQIIAFISESEVPAGKREIAREFGLKGREKILLKALLKDMADEGLIDTAPGRAFHKMGGVPKVTVLRIVDVHDGIVAVPDNWHAEGKPPPLIRVAADKRSQILTVGDRILARTEERGNGYAAHMMKKLRAGTEFIMGIIEAEGGADIEAGLRPPAFWLRSIDKKMRHDWRITDMRDARPGDLVLAEPQGRAPRQSVRVEQVLGDPFAPRSFSLIAIHKHGIPHHFTDETLGEADRVAGLDLAYANREDLTHLPIVAIDPVDARDYDDAIWAVPDDDPDNPGGFLALIVIADVSFYVRPGSLLDREARKRGNSVYFPDRVVPMLPEALSADKCSLRAGEDRAVMACHLTIDRHGVVRGWKFTRAIARIRANIPYEVAQAAIDRIDGNVRQLDDSLEDRYAALIPGSDLVDCALRPLWACWQVLAKARAKREPLDLDLPERRVVLNDAGSILSVAVRERLDAHRLVEDYMIAANVAAAKALEAKKAPVMYRIHESPSREKLVALKEYLATHDIAFSLGQVIKPATFNHVIARLDDQGTRPQIMEQILRSQTQAYYGPENVGHFGLALGSYAHFTSPIRRYADLLVHRALAGAYGLEMPKPVDRRIGPSTALSAEDFAGLGKIGELISQFERRAMMAERETVDRYVAAFLATKVGEIVGTRITGVQRFGFFATVEGLGGDGLVPVSTLGVEYFRYDEAAQALVGVDSGDTYVTGQRIDLRLVEANPITGSLRFELVEGTCQLSDRRTKIHDRRRGSKNGSFKMTGTRGRPANIRHRSRRR